jgi:hypothetical protein
VMYCYMDDLGNWFKRLFAGKASAAGTKPSHST